MTRQQIIGGVREQIVMLLDSERRIEDGDLLTDHGLDSMANVELILELEARFGVEFENSELVFDNFSTITNITDLLQAKLGGDE